VVNGFQSMAGKHAVLVTARHQKEPLNLEQFVDGREERLLNRDGFKNPASLLVLTVSDTGPGISPDILPRIFDPYFTTKSAMQGTGLGLNVVQRLVKESRSALHVKTKLGHGTTFIIYVPTS